jgi:hypothetical protein
MLKPTLTAAERLILTNLGGRRWTIKRYRRPGATRRAQAAWAELRQAAGYTTTTGWMTTEKTNPKMRKNGKPSIGLTLHAAANASRAWATLDATQRQSLAAALDVTVGEIDSGLRATVCPRSTRSCRKACVVAHSANGDLDRSQLARLVRTLFTLFRPADALVLTARELDKLRSKHGRYQCRWRMNVSDDIRWELLAPGLFAVAPRAYAYTKWSPGERPARAGLRLVYSASERTHDSDIVAWCKQGHRVAVVFDVKRGQPLPATWHGVPVVDGDLTDDLYRHHAGHIVGLRAKGTLGQRQLMRLAGFARPAIPTAAPVALPVRRQLTMPTTALAA